MLRDSQSWLAASLIALSAGVTPLGRAGELTLEAKLLESQGGARTSSSGLLLRIDVQGEEPPGSLRPENFEIFLSSDGTPLAASRHQVKAIFMKFALGSYCFDVRGRPEDPVTGKFRLLARVVVDGKMLATTQIGAEMNEEEGSLDVALIIDESLSMADNDQKKLRLAAAKSFVDLSARGGRIGKVGVVAFNEKARTLRPLTSPGRKYALHQAIDQIGAKGRTDMDAALDEAARLLTASGNREKAAILLSDGKDEPGKYEDAHTRFVSNQWTVYTIGLSDRADKDTLVRIARDTRGQYYDAPTNAELQQIFAEICQALQRKSLIRQSGRALPEAGALTETVPIDETVSSVTFACQSEAGPVRLGIVGEDRQEIPEASALFGGKENYRFCDVWEPKPGLWTLRVSPEAPSAGRLAQLTITARTPLFLRMFPLKEQYDRGEPVEIACSLANGVTPITDAEVIARFTAADGSRSELTLHDDGAHDDTGRADGVYAAIFPGTDVPGVCEVMLAARGRTSGDHRFARATIHHVQITETGHSRLWVAKRLLDFGTLYNGEQEKLDLELKLVSQVRSAREAAKIAAPELHSADGTELPAPSFTVMPGPLEISAKELRTLSLTLTVPPGQKAGRYEGPLTVGSKYDEQTIVLRVEVRNPELQLEPAKLVLDPIESGQGANATVQLKIAPRGRLGCVGMLSKFTGEAGEPAPEIRSAALPALPPLTPEARLLPLSLETDAATPTGRYDATLTLQTRFGRSAIPVQLSVIKPEIKSAPEQLHFEVKEPGVTVRQSLRVKLAGLKPREVRLALTDCTSEGEHVLPKERFAFAETVAAIEPGKERLIEIALQPPALQPPGRYVGTVRLTSTAGPVEQPCVVDVLPSPTFRLSVAQIDFGRIAAGGRAERELTLRSLIGETQQVRFLEARGPAEAAKLRAVPNELALAARAEARVRLECEALAPAQVGTHEYALDVAGPTGVRVPLGARVEIFAPVPETPAEVATLPPKPTVEVSTQLVDLGFLQSGQSKQGQLALKSLIDDDQTLEVVARSSESEPVVFAVEPNELSLAAGESAQLTVTCTADSGASEGGYEATFEIRGPSEPTTFHAIATVQEPPAPIVPAVVSEAETPPRPLWGKLLTIALLIIALIIFGVLVWLLLRWVSQLRFGYMFKYFLFSAILHVACLFLALDIFMLSKVAKDEDFGPTLKVKLEELKQAIASIPGEWVSSADRPLPVKERENQIQQQRAAAEHAGEKAMQALKAQMVDAKALEPQKQQEQLRSELVESKRADAKKAAERMEKLLTEVAEAQKRMQERAETERTAETAIDKARAVLEAEKAALDARQEQQQARSAQTQTQAVDLAAQMAHQETADTKQDVARLEKLLAEIKAVEQKMAEQPAATPAAAHAEIAKARAEDRAAKERARSASATSEAVALNVKKLLATLSTSELDPAKSAEDQTEKRAAQRIEDLRTELTTVAAKVEKSVAEAGIADLAASKRTAHAREQRERVAPPADQAEDARAAAIAKDAELAAARGELAERASLEAKALASKQKEALEAALAEMQPKEADDHGAVAEAAETGMARRLGAEDRAAKQRAQSASATSEAIAANVKKLLATRPTSELDPAKSAEDQTEKRAAQPVEDLRTELTTVAAKVEESVAEAGVAEVAAAKRTAQAREQRERAAPPDHQAQAEEARAAAIAKDAELAAARGELAERASLEAKALASKQEEALEAALAEMQPKEADERGAAAEAAETGMARRPGAEADDKARTAVTALAGEAAVPQVTPTAAPSHKATPSLDQAPSTEKTQTPLAPDETLRPELTEAAERLEDVAPGEPSAAQRVAVQAVRPSQPGGKAAHEAASREAGPRASAPLTVKPDGLEPASVEIREASERGFFASPARGVPAVDTLVFHQKVDKAERTELPSVDVLPFRRSISMPDAKPSEERTAAPLAGSPRESSVAKLQASLVFAAVPRESAAAKVSASRAHGPQITIDAPEPSAVSSSEGRAGEAVPQPLDRSRDGVEMAKGRAAASGTEDTATEVAVALAAHLQQATLGSSREETPKHVAQTAPRIETALALPEARASAEPAAPTEAELGAVARREARPETSPARLVESKTDAGAGPVQGADIQKAAANLTSEPARLALPPEKQARASQQQIAVDISAPAEARVAGGAQPDVADAIVGLARARAVDAADPSLASPAPAEGAPAAAQGAVRSTGAPAADASLARIAAALDKADIGPRELAALGLATATRAETRRRGEAPSSAQPTAPQRRPVEPAPEIGTEPILLAYAGDIAALVSLPAPSAAGPTAAMAEKAGDESKAMSAEPVELETEAIDVPRAKRSVEAGPSDDGNAETQIVRRGADAGRGRAAAVAQVAALSARLALNASPPASATRADLAGTQAPVAAKSVAMRAEALEPSVTAPTEIATAAAGSDEAPAELAIDKQAATATPEDAARDTLVEQTARLSAAKQPPAETLHKAIMPAAAARPAKAPSRMPQALTGGSETTGKFTLTLAKYENGDWDCDRSALPFLSSQIERRIGFVIDAETREIALSDARLRRSPFVFMTGHQDFTLTDAERANLRRYLLGGGFLWGDDCTDEKDSTFDRAFRREIAQVLPEAKIEKLRQSHPIFSSCYDLAHGYRGFTVPPGDKYRCSYIEGIHLGERTAVIYTRNDYGCALEIDFATTAPVMQSLSGVSPYEMQEGATQMAMNLVMYFHGHVKSGEEGRDQITELLDKIVTHVRRAPEWELATKLSKKDVQIERLEYVSLDDQWLREEWSDPAKMDVVKVLDEHAVRVLARPGPSGKTVVSKDMQAEVDLSKHDWVLLDIMSTMPGLVRISLGVFTMPDWQYFESPPAFVKPGLNRDVFFSLQDGNYKCEATEWKHRSKVENRQAVRKLAFLIYPIDAGRITFKGLRAVRRK